jgi:hypothetical protein
MSLCNHRRKGSTLLEFTLVGIPLIFILISVFEMARGMWIYHTLAHATKEGTRFTIVHGHNCTLAPNSCVVTVADIATRIKDAGVGLLPNELNVVLMSQTSTVPCMPLSNCLSNSAPWPTFPSNQPGMDITINARYPFRSAISMFWPGGGPGVNFGTFNLPASSTETIQF